MSNATRMFITLGTSWIYRLRSTGEIVANCHKEPATSFERSRMTVGQTVDTLAQAVNTLSSANPQLKIIFTVSPIRHWKDGAHGNQLSKATLLLAIDELCNIFPRSVSYFPAYELMMDDLRDYRFYAPDMLHPSETAIDYIFEHFSHTFFSDETTTQIKQVSKITTAAAHRPLNAADKAYKEFCLKFLTMTQETQQRIPGIDLRNEIEKFRQGAAQNGKG